MGNSQTKEPRGSGESGRHGRHASQQVEPPSPRTEPGFDNVPRPSEPRRGSRPDLSFLGIGGNSERDVLSLEQRRENKAEREARKLEKERNNRLRERERSMEEEHIDGGFLVTQGVYVGPEDFSKGIVRQLMVSRKVYGS